MRLIAAVLPALAGAALAFAEANPPAAPRDSVTITNHSAFRASTSPGATMPDRVAIKLEIRYELASTAKGVLSLALDEKEAMDFSTVDSAPVTHGSGEVTLKASVRMFERETLHGIVLLRKIAPAPGEKSLAITSIEMDLKTLRRH